ncbi:MAG: hypothetical protein HFH59_06735 [Lachnospiraceae bacterium]|nr:hypothetical protein [Lachnospiraceae bacterium]
MKNPESCAGKECTADKRHPVPGMRRACRNRAEKYLAYMQRLEEIRRL